MKKFTTFLASFLFATLLYCNIAFASVILDACDNANFVTLPTATSGYGLTVTPISFNPGFTSNQSANNPDMYGEPYIGVACINGLTLVLENTTNNVLVVSWKDSVISVDGQVYGIPFMSGMKYVDAGNPSATPNTVIPPGAKITIAANIPDVGLVSRRWQIHGAPLLKSKAREFSLYLAINSNGATNYLTVTAPGIKVM